MDFNQFNRVDGSAAARRLFMVLSPRSLGYARLALESLFRNAVEQFDLTLITDSDDDKSILGGEIARLGATKPDNHDLAIFSEDDLRARESEIFGGHPNILSFRHGHPCWRKVT